MVAESVIILCILSSWTACSHCFPVTLNHSQPDVFGINGVLQAYAQSFQYVCFSRVFVFIYAQSYKPFLLQEWSRGIVRSNLFCSNAESGACVESGGMVWGYFLALSDPLDRKLGLAPLLMLSRYSRHRSPLRSLRVHGWPNVTLVCSDA